MRVAFVDQRGDEAGGAEQSLRLLLRHLGPAVEPALIVFEDGAFAEQMRGDGLDVRVVELGANTGRSTRERLRASAALELPGHVARVARTLRDLRAEVVHTNTVKAHVVGAAAARLAGVPAVAHLRDVLHGTGRRVVRTAIRVGARERIAISRRVGASFALARTEVIDNPLELTAYAHLPERPAARARLDLPSDAPVVAIVGRINRWKGQDRFLRAFARVAAREPCVALVVGAPVFRDADFLPELHALAASLGIAERVRFAGWVEDPRDVYAASDVHVNASTEEPFGRTTIEAAAAGVPTVCFDDSGVAETMAPGAGIVVPAADETALAEGIARYVADPAFRRASGEAARTWSARFDADEHARRVTRVLVRAARQT